MSNQSHAASTRLAGRNALLLLTVLLPAACGKKEAMNLPKPEVFVTPAVVKDVPVTMEQVGQTQGSKDVEIRARVEGYLESVDFREGGFVKEGDLLYRIDPKPFEAAVASQKAQVATMLAKLDQAETDVGRLKPLSEQQAVSRRDYDNAVTSRDAAKAQLDAAKAALDKAQLDLGYATIKAPMSGLADLTKVKAGNLVGRGESTLLTTISVIDPIAFSASITEANYLKVAERAIAAKATGRERPEESVLDLILADGTVYPLKGQLDAVQRAVDSKTGTLAIRFLFPNPERLIRPGQYGRIRFVPETLVDAVCVPQKAVTELQGVFQVVVVGEGNKAEIRTVKMGSRSGNLWVVAEGLKAGEKVVVEGLQQVKPGAEVNPKPVEELKKAEGRIEKAASGEKSDSQKPVGR